MYPEAAIKASFPKNLWDYRVKIANKVSFIFDRRPVTKNQSHEWRRALRPLTDWLKKTSDKKEAPLNTRDLFKRPSMKKRHP
jgi:hypothetical protein